MSTFSFGKMFNSQTGKVMVLDNEQSINDCLSMLVSTCKGELLGDPNFGTNIKKYLMNYRGDPLFQLVKEDLVKSIRGYEKRVVVDISSIKLSQVEDYPNLIYITIFYKDLSSGTVKKFSTAVSGEVFEQ